MNKFLEKRGADGYNGIKGRVWLLAQSFLEVKNMSFKVAFIGAGSVGFTRKLLSDLLTVPEFHDIEVAFTDINPHNLDMVYQLCQRDIEENGPNFSYFPVSVPMCFIPAFSMTLPEATFSVIWSAMIRSTSSSSKAKRMTAFRTSVP